MKCLFVFLSILVLQTGLRAQTKIKPEDIEVRDSSGTVYPAIVWQRMLQSGQYGLKLSGDSKTGTIRRLTGEEIETRFSKMPKPKESTFFRTGEKLSAFNEKDINGTRFQLKALAGKVVVLNFWFINCPPCRQEIPDLNEMVADFKNSKDVVFIAVGLDQKYDIKEFLNSYPFNYNIIDNGRYLAAQYNINLYPTHVVLDKQGKVIFHTSGLAMNTVRWVRKSIEAALLDTVPQ